MPRHSPLALNDPALPDRVPEFPVAVVSRLAVDHETGSSSSAAHLVFASGTEVSPDSLDYLAYPETLVQMSVPGLHAWVICGGLGYWLGCVLADIPSCR